MNLFAEGTKNNPNTKAKKEQENSRAWQRAESDRLQAEQEKFVTERFDLMATMTEDEWEKFLQAEAIENAKVRSTTTKQYELR